MRQVGDSPAGINQLVRAFHPIELRQAAVAGLERIAQAGLPPFLEQRISPDLAKARADPLSVAFANLGFAYGRDRRVVELARELAGHQDPEVRERTVRLLAMIGETDLVAAAAGDPTPVVRAGAAEMLGYYATTTADLEALARLSADPDPEVAAKARAAQRQQGVKPVRVAKPTAPPRAGDQAWIDLLDRLAAKALADKELAAGLPEAALESGWLGAPPATEAELAALEARLGRRLPASYRSFLGTSNGWGPTSFKLQRLFPAAEVRPFAETEPEWLEVWADSDLAPALRIAIQVGAGDGVCLLIPSDRPEWECWFFASWIPGEQSHPSFRAFMEQELTAP